MIGSFWLLLVLGHVFEIPFAGELVAMENVEAIRIDDDILANHQVPGGIEGISGLVLVLLDFQKLPFIKP
jgi:hypothetical protein